MVPPGGEEMAQIPRAVSRSCTPAAGEGDGGVTPFVDSRVDMWRMMVGMMAWQEFSGFFSAVLLAAAADLEAGGAGAAVAMEAAAALLLEGGGGVRSRGQRDDAGRQRDQAEMHHLCEALLRAALFGPEGRTGMGHASSSLAVRALAYYAPCQPGQEQGFDEWVWRILDEALEAAAGLAAAARTRQRAYQLAAVLVRAGGGGASRPRGRVDPRLEAALQRVALRLRDGLATREEGDGHGARCRQDLGVLDSAAGSALVLSSVAGLSLLACMLALVKALSNSTPCRMYAHKAYVYTHMVHVSLHVVRSLSTDAAVDAAVIASTPGVLWQAL